VTDTPDVEPDVTLDDTPEDDGLFLTSRATYRAEVKTTDSYHGRSHWIGVSLEDTPTPLIDDDGNVVGFEDAESLIYRVEQIALQRLNALVHLNRRQLDLRKQADIAARTNPATETKD
jgi:hypothetical protein